MNDNKEAVVDYENDPKYKLSDLEVPDSFMNVSKSLQRTDYRVPGSRVFAIPSFLSESECKKLIELTETVGYKNVDWEYSKHYRDCTRLLTKSEKFAKEIWRRLLPLLVREDVADVRPFGFGTKGVWRPISINECIRFTKYQTGNHFQPHRDGAFVKTDDNRSIYTFMVYLNKSVEGGKTKFYSSEDNEKFKEEVAITPETGTALIFNHDVWHEGEQVSGGLKYILRTDIMFERVAVDISESQEDYLNDPDYIKAMELYDKSIEYQKKGDPAESTLFYLRALDMQAKIKSIPPEQTSNWLGLAYDVSGIILNLLGNKDLLVCARVSKSWRRRARDSGLWRTRFEKDFAFIARVEMDSIGDKFSDVTKNWYVIYKNRYLVEKKFRVFVIDVGAHTTKYSVLGGEVRTFPSKAAKFKGHYWASSYGASHYLIGREVEKYQHRAYDAQVPFHSNGDINRDIYEKIVGAVAERGFSKKGMQELYYYDTDSTAHPAIIATNGKEHPEVLWKLLLENCYHFFPYICVIDSAVLGLLAKGFQSGIMVSVGHMHIRITTVWKMTVLLDKPIEIDTSLIKWEESNELNAIATSLAKMTSTAIKTQSPEKRDILREHIVVSGVPSMKIIDLFKEKLSQIPGKVHTWSTKEENESYVLIGAKVMCALPEPKNLFKSVKGHTPSDADMKLKLPTGTWNDRDHNPYKPKVKEKLDCKPQ